METTPSKADYQQNFPGLPPFPDDVPTAPLLRVNLARLIVDDEEEVSKLWKACCELGFFYLDLRDPDAEPQKHDNGKTSMNAGTNKHGVNETKLNGHNVNGHANGDTNGVHGHQHQKIDSVGFQKDADALFKVAEEFFQLPVEEKVKYDFSKQGSYFGYKGYGAAIIDKHGTQDRNEFYNTSKDDILNLSPPLPAPTLLSPHRPLLSSFITTSHALITLLLTHLSTHLHLPPTTLPLLHRLSQPSGDQIRFVHAPPQPPSDLRTALGEHTDFGSITLLFNRLGGLQVLPPGANATWLYVRPLPGHCVVNLGDAMVKFTAGVLRSNIHRVVSPPGEQAGGERYSVVYFGRPEDEVVLRRVRGSRVVEGRVEREGLGVGEEEEEGEGVSAREWVLRRALTRRNGGKWEEGGGTEEVSRRARGEGVAV